MQANNIYQADKETAWCPGCGNFPLRKALTSALEELEIKPEEAALLPVLVKRPRCLILSELMDLMVCMGDLYRRQSE